MRSSPTRTASSTDWDGNWQHAASEDETGWYSEMLIPWYIAPMAKGKDGKRTFRIYLDRVIGSTGERSAWPAASFERPRFLSDFTPIELPVYNQSLIAITPVRVGAVRHGAARARTSTPAPTSSGSRTASSS